MFRVVLAVVFAGLSLSSTRSCADAIYVGLVEQSSIVISNVPHSDDFILLVSEPQDQVAVPSRGQASSLAHTDSALPLPLLERAKLYVPLVEDAARESRLDARLLHAVIAAESAYNPLARSPKGAVGIMQLLPATAQRFGVADSWDARQNISGGARYLADLLKLFNNDTGLALAAYNAGEGAVLRYSGRIPPFRETQAYVPRVLALYRRFQSAAL